MTLPAGFWFSASDCYQPLGSGGERPSDGRGKISRLREFDADSFGNIAGKVSKARSGMAIDHKNPIAVFPALEARVQHLHSYDVLEIIAI